MEIIVQKFGGTSVSTMENRDRCVEHVRTELNNGKSIVVVVSAMGRSGDPYATDTLLSLLGDNVEQKEKDLLVSTGEIISSVVFSSLLKKRGIDSVVLTREKAGIFTNDNFTSALITDVKASRIVEELAKGKVVVVPGFQGITEAGEITTLGRGGSDTSAAALAAGLRAEQVDIFTDVEGLMTADPRIVADARFLETIAYESAAQMAHSGAKIIHPRAVELAMKHDIPMRIRSTFSQKTGTMVTRKKVGISDYDAKETIISGIVSNSNIHRFTVQKKKEEQESAQFEELFSFLKKEEISIDFINVTRNAVYFTVSNGESEKLGHFLSNSGHEYNREEQVAKVSVIGSAINGVPGIMSIILETLSKHKIGVKQTSDSNTTIWLLVDKANEVKAVQEIHKRFFTN